MVPRWHRLNFFYYINAICQFANLSLSNKIPSSFHKNVFISEPHQASHNPNWTPFHCVTIHPNMQPFLPHSILKSLKHIQLYLPQNGLHNNLSYAEAVGGDTPISINTTSSTSTHYGSFCQICQREDKPCETHVWGS
jgi:hypothetical protein